MSSADTTLIGVKLQAVGENLNTWGDPNLNNDLSVLARAIHGWQSITITGDYTVTDTQYGTSNESEVATIRLTGSPAAAFNFVLPSRQRRLVIHNATGQTATIKHSASTGFAMAAGATVIAASDGSEVYNRTPTFIGTSFVPSNAGDITNKQYVDNLVANSTIPAATGALFVSGSDASASYLQGALTFEGPVSSSIVNAGADENLQIKVGYLGLTRQAEQTTAFSPTANNFYPVYTSSSLNMTLTALTQGDVIGIAKYGTNPLTLTPSGTTINGSSAPFVIDDEQTLFLYQSSVRGWV